MTVLETTGADENGTKEPIRFPGSKDERREERIRRRLERSKTGDSIDDFLSPLAEFEPNVRAPQVEPEVESPAPRERRALIKARFSISWTFASFLLMVAIPGALTSIYFALFASPQYVIETQFSVRGSSQSSMASFGLSGLFGSSVQSGDSYIAASYIESVQLLRDVKEQLGVDLRQYYSKNDIDYLYRISPDMPLEKFTDYWRNMIEVSFNSTTGNITLYVYAFSSDDAKAVADDVLKVSETLVNNLSEANRQQMTAVANKQVERSEDRLRKVREQIRQLRTQQKQIDFKSLAGSEMELTQALEKDLQSLKTRQATLLQSVNKDSPSARTLQKQINASAAALAEQKARMGATEDNDDNRKLGNDTNLAEALNKFEELTVEQGFATQAYTTSLAAFETALAETQKQERYFATFVAPMRPEIALYPKRLLDSFIAFLVLLAIWMISQFLYRSFRDHAI
jgi:capsular polysaccharide transport system permease protein